MALLKYGSYQHTIMPAVSMRSERVGQPGGVRQATRRVWEVSGTLTGSSPSDLKTQINALETAYASDGQDLTLYDNNGVTVLEQLDSSEALHGTRVLRRPEFPEGKGAQYATIRDFSIVVEAVFLDAGAPFTDAWGAKRETIREMSDGTHAVTVAGEYTGETLSAARNAAAAAKESGYVVVSETTTEDADQKKVGFSYEYIDTTESREVISFSEEVGLAEAAVRTVYREILDGSAPIKQTTTIRPAQGWQRGRAMGRTGRPDFPAVKWGSSYLVEPVRKTKGSPRRLADGLTGYPISWDYRFAFATTPSFPDPGVPPDGS